MNGMSAAAVAASARARTLAEQHAMRNFLYVTVTAVLLALPMAGFVIDVFGRSH